MKPLYAILSVLAAVFCGTMVTAWRIATWPKDRMYFLSEDERLSVALGGGCLIFMWIVIIVIAIYFFLKCTE